MSEENINGLRFNEYNRYSLDCSRLETIEDVILVLSVLDISFPITNEYIQEHPLKKFLVKEE